jgi:hypothetical protein
MNDPSSTRDIRNAFKAVLDRKSYKNFRRD